MGQAGACAGFGCRVNAVEHKLLLDKHYVIPFITSLTNLIPPPLRAQVNVTYGGSKVAPSVLPSTCVQISAAPLSLAGAGTITYACTFAGLAAANSTVLNFTSIGLIAGERAAADNQGGMQCNTSARQCSLLCRHRWFECFLVLGDLGLQALSPSSPTCR